MVTKRDLRETIKEQKKIISKLGCENADLERRNYDLKRQVQGAKKALCEHCINSIHYRYGIDNICFGEVSDRICILEAKNICTDFRRIPQK